MFKYFVNCIIVCDRIYVCVQFWSFIDNFFYWQISYFIGFEVYLVGFFEYVKGLYENKKFNEVINFMMMRYIV